jgi:predicted DNA-binding transcriptional regulator AlpA
MESSTISPGDLPELLSTRAAAHLCGVGERTLWRHSHSGVAPAPVRIGGSVRYRRSDLVGWIEAGCPRCASSWKPQTEGATI